MPPHLRDVLQLHPGDQVEVYLDVDGRVVMQRLPQPSSVQSLPIAQQLDKLRLLKGMLYSPDRSPVSIEAMQRAIADQVQQQWNQA